MPVDLASAWPELAGASAALFVVCVIELIRARRRRRRFGVHISED